MDCDNHNYFYMKDLIRKLASAIADANHEGREADYNDLKNVIGVPYSHFQAPATNAKRALDFLIGNHFVNAHQDGRTRKKFFRLKAPFKKIVSQLEEMKIPDARPQRVKHKKLHYTEVGKKPDDHIADDDKMVEDSADPSWRKEAPFPKGLPDIEKILNERDARSITIQAKDVRITIEF